MASYDLSWRACPRESALALENASLRAQIERTYNAPIFKDGAYYYTATNMCKVIQNLYSVLGCIRKHVEKGEEVLDVVRTVTARMPFSDNQLAVLASVRKLSFENDELLEFVEFVSSAMRLENHSVPGPVDLNIVYG